MKKNIIPKVSVIIPVYNREDRIILSLKSVLNQTYKNLEVIIVDDASTDNTSKILKPFIDNKKVRYYRLRKNSGKPSIVRNYGIRKSKGEYIAFIDSDDIWLKDKLTLQFNFIRNSDVELGYVFCDAFVRNSGNKRMERFITQQNFYNNFKNYITRKNNYGYILDKQLFFEYLLVDFLVFNQTVLIKREIILKYSCFNENLTYGEDNDLWMKVARDFSIGYIDKPLFVYVKHEDNLMNNDNARIQDNICLYNHNYNLAIKNKISRCTVNKIKRRLIFFEVRYFTLLLGKKDYKQSIKQLIHLLKTKPILSIYYLFIIKGVTK